VALVSTFNNTGDLNLAQGESVPWEPCCPPASARPAFPWRWPLVAILGGLVERAAIYPEAKNCRRPEGGRPRPGHGKEPDRSERWLQGTAGERTVAAGLPGACSGGAACGVAIKWPWVWKLRDN